MLAVNKINTGLQKTLSKNTQPSKKILGGADKVTFCGSSEIKAAKKFTEALHGEITSKLGIKNKPKLIVDDGKNLEH